jgi:hypothetical protein
MDKPRNEMTNDAAKFVLHSYRPNGADARDPRFRVALDQAARDPELARWFNEQRKLDAFVANKLVEIQPPADLSASIFAGLKNRHGSRPARWPYILSFAAVFVLSGFLLLSMYMDQGRGQGWLREFQRANLAMLSSPDLPKHLDLVTDDFAKTQEYLTKMNAPRPPELRGALLALPTVGCKVFFWNNRQLSLTCFKLPGGDLLHLIVIAKNPIPATHFAEHMQEQDGWHIKYERREGLLLIFFSRAPMTEMKQYT